MCALDFFLPRIRPGSISVSCSRQVLCHPAYLEIYMFSPILQTGLTVVCACILYYSTCTASRYVWNVNAAQTQVQPSSSTPTTCILPYILKRNTQPPFSEKANTASLLPVYRFAGRLCCAAFLNSLKSMSCYRLIMSRSKVFLTIYFLFLSTATLTTAQLWKHPS